MPSVGVLSLLGDARLLDFAGGLAELGVDNEEDLSFITGADVDTLRMTTIQSRRLLALSAASQAKFKVNSSSFGAPSSKSVRSVEGGYDRFSSDDAEEPEFEHGIPEKTPFNSGPIGYVVSAAVEAEVQKEVARLNLDMVEMGQLLTEQRERFKQLEDAMRAMLKNEATLREESENHLLVAIREEAGLREAAIESERQSREAICADLMARWKAQLQQEQQLRADEDAKLLARIHDEGEMLETALKQERNAREHEHVEMVAKWEKNLQDEQEMRASGDDKLIKTLQEEADMLESAIKHEREARETDSATLLNTLHEEAAMQEEAIKHEREAREVESAHIVAEWTQKLQEEQKVRASGDEKLLTSLHEEAEMLEEALKHEREAREVECAEIEQKLQAEQANRERGYKMLEEALSHEREALKQEWAGISVPLQEKLLEEQQVRASEDEKLQHALQEEGEILEAALQHEREARKAGDDKLESALKEEGQMLEASLQHERELRQANDEKLTKALHEEADMLDAAHQHKKKLLTSELSSSSLN